MKKLIISFTIMCSMLLSMVGVFAASQYVTVSDNWYYRKGYADNGYALFSGTHNTSTDRLSNVQYSKGEYGDVTVVLKDIVRGQQTATMTSEYYRDGVYKSFYYHNLP